MYKSLSISLFAIFLFSCLLFYNSYDPSWNVVTASPVSHKLGVVGSYIADLFFQLMGGGSFVCIAALLVWSIHNIWLNDSAFMFITRAMFFSVLIFSSSTLIDAYGLDWQDSSGGLIGMVLVDYPRWFLMILVFISITGLVFDKRLFFLLLNMVTAPFTNRVLLVKSSEQLDITQSEKKEDETSEVFTQPTSEIKKFVQKMRIKKKVEKDLDNQHVFIAPSVDFLKKPKESVRRITETETNHNLKSLERVLGEFGVNGKIVNVRYGPVVTLYELEPSAGTKSSRVIGLSDDIARSMSALSTRISIIPGQNLLGIELPNKDREIVYLRDLFEAKEYKDPSLKLPIALGKGINGEPVIADLTKMPHLLVAGTTGSGKSVAINTMILSLIYSLRPDQCKMIMIDPKMLELSVYDAIPHLISPVVTNPKKAITALKWVVKEMEERYKNMSALGVRNIIGFNEKIKEAQDKKKPLERVIQTGFDKETGGPVFERIPISRELLPYIVVIVDEMADLMLVAGKEIESSIQRLAQMARAAGIHIIMATQRPSVDVITGVIKANFPTRISFAVTSKIDSRTILGEQGAEQLLGMGDMLYMISGGRIIRVHGPFVSDNEVQSIVDYLKSQGNPSYTEDVTKDDSEDGAGDVSTDYVEDEEGDLYRQAVSIVMDSKKSSISYVQRQLRIGYNRAANLIERMEREGILSPPNHSGKREIIDIHS